MNTTFDKNKSQHPFVAGFWLIIAIPIFVLALLPILKALHTDDIATLPGMAAMSIVHIAAGYMWAKSLGKHSGLPDNKTMNLLSGIGFALGVVGFLILFTSNTQAGDGINKWLAAFKGNGNLEFGALFAPWTGLVAGISGFALGLGLKDWKLALKLLSFGFITGFAIYLVIMFTMQLLGFKVGSGKPVMLPTTFLSMWVTSLVGSAIFGKLLSDRK